MNSAKEKERKCMCDAIICGLFTKEFGPNGPMRIVQCENDPPDFIITKRKYSVSVEVTYVSEPCVIAPLQYTLNSIVKKTIKILDKNKSEKYDIKLAFDTAIRGASLNEDVAAKQIAEIIGDFENIYKNNNDKRIIEMRETERGRYLIHFNNGYGVELVLFFSKINAGRSRGGAAIKAFGYLNNYEAVLRAIKKKERNLIRYKSNYNKNYLLLVTDPSVILANKFSFDEEFYNHQFETTFDKIFLLEIDWDYSCKATELRIRKIIA